MHKARALIRASVVAAAFAAPLSHLTCASRTTGPEVPLPPPLIEEPAPQDNKGRPPLQNEDERKDEERKRLVPPDVQERENLRLMLASIRWPDARA